jgi:hypothetical protein
MTVFIFIFYTERTMFRFIGSVLSCQFARMKLTRPSKPNVAIA